MRGSSEQRRREKRRERCNVNQGRKEPNERRNNSYINGTQLRTSILSLQRSALTLCESEWVCVCVSVWKCFHIFSLYCEAWRWGQKIKEKIKVSFLSLYVCGGLRSCWFNGDWQLFILFYFLKNHLRGDKGKVEKMQFWPLAFSRDIKSRRLFVQGVFHSGGGELFLLQAVVKSDGWCLIDSCVCRVPLLFKTRGFC